MTNILTTENNTISKPDYHIVSFSGGKDSTAMLLRMVEENWPIDEIIFLDTGLEFPSMYEHIEKVEKTIGRPITKIKGEEDFEYLLTKKKHIRNKKAKNPEDREEMIGFGWPSMPVRWCTHELKDAPRDKYLKELKKQYHLIHYMGIAADETKRLEKKRHQAGNQIYPLVEWNMSEADCLKYCYERGFDWGGLYEQFDRVSCWCCPLNNIPEIRNLYKFHPDLWEELKRLDGLARNKYLRDWSVWELEYRFEKEKVWHESGKNIRSRKFFVELREELAKEETYRSKVNK